MEFLYAFINFLLLALIIWLLFRKKLIAIFRGRREKINAELDAAEARALSAAESDHVVFEETVSDEVATDAVPAAVEPGKTVSDESVSDDDVISEEWQNTAEKIEKLGARTDREIGNIRRGATVETRDAFIRKLRDRAGELLSSEPYASAIRANQPAMADKILNEIRVTSGDMAYLRTHDVLYVTLTSAEPLPEEIVGKIRTRITAMLDEVGGKPSFRVNEDPALLGGLRLRIGDTVYDCTVADKLYTLEKTLEKRSIRGDENADEIIGDILEGINVTDFGVDKFQLGRVISVSDGICWMDGLADIMYGEVVEFECGERGMVLDIQHDRIGCVIYGRYEHIEAGSRVRRVGRIASVYVGDELLGRVVDPLGHPLDAMGRVFTSLRRPIEFPAPAITDRAPVSRPLATGIKAIDAMVPIGKGQRELIVGDRQSGKTAIIVDTIINQKGKGVPCVYVAIGQKDTTVAEIREKLTAYGAMDYTVIVCAPAASSASMQYIAPFAGAAIAEHFMYSGKDALIIYDDLSKHAVAYRELSLLLHRPSGREAYPGDVFYLHSRLLERAAQLSAEKGGGSLTALPVIETQAGDISAYIPTNVISITDGQIFLDSDLFNEGQRPAVNVGLSVSRVGGAAQTKLMKQVSASLRMNLAQYRELENFSQFGSEVDDATRRVLSSGKRMTYALRQNRLQPLPEWKQALIIFAASDPCTDGVEPEQMAEFEDALFEYAEFKRPDLVRLLRTGAKLSDKSADELRSFISGFVASRNASGGVN